MELAAKDRFELITLHTGQHYDENMSQVFFDQLGMSKPHFTLNIGSSEHGEQTAKMMIEIEKLCLDVKPDAILVYGDTNSTLAGALVASKQHIPVFHVEAGLRSFNKKMPEEINRILTDHISSLLFVPSQQSIDNLKKEGIVNGVYVVGDIMKDVVHYIRHSYLSNKPNLNYPFYYVTLHRPHNVDKKERLSRILNELNQLQGKAIFAIHPRTRNRMKSFGLREGDYQNIHFIDPQGYLENIGYLEECQALITDSGGMQKEAYWMKKKCITIRTETEWIETLHDGNNTLIYNKLCELKKAVKIRSTNWNKYLYGNRNTANMIVDSVLNFLD